MDTEKVIWNPYMPLTEHVPDGEPRLFGDRVYVYGSHDSSHGTAFCTEDYVCWSAPAEDLKSWRYEGIIYRKEEDPLNRDRKLNMYAPDCVQGPDGRFYLYYELSGVAQISVAVCDTPAGEFRYYGSVGQQGNNGAWQVMDTPMPFDPGVLVDEGHVYLYCGFCTGARDHGIPFLANDRGCYVVELAGDMRTQLTEPRYLIPGVFAAADTEFAGHPFFEASSIRKIGEKYYFIYSSILSHELCYAVSDAPDRGFSYGGVIVSNGDIGLYGRKPWHRVAYTGNTHGSIICVGGQWYVFYHRHTEAIRCCRQACAEPIRILPDGSIPQVEITSQGLNLKPLPTGRPYSAAICCHLVQEPGAFHIEGEGNFRAEAPYVLEEDGTGIVAHIANKTHVGYKYFRFSGHETSIVLQLRGKAKGELTASVDGSSLPWLSGQEGLELGRLPVSLSSDRWTAYELPVIRAEGDHAFYLRFEGEGALDIQSFVIR